MKPNFCLVCAERLVKRTTTEYDCPNGHTYWNGPHCGVSIVLLRDGDVLLAKRGIAPYKNLYGLPGGFVNHLEQPRTAAKREMREETGMDVSDLQLIDARTQPYADDESAVSLVFLAGSWSGEPQAGDDAAGLRWMPIDFIDGDGFAWHYPGLSDRLKIIHQQGAQHAN